MQQNPKTLLISILQPPPTLPIPEIFPHEISFGAELRVLCGILSLRSTFPRELRVLCILSLKIHISSEMTASGEFGAVRLGFSKYANEKTGVQGP